MFIVNVPEEQKIFSKTFANFFYRPKNKKYFYDFIISLKNERPSPLPNIPQRFFNFTQTIPNVPKRFPKFGK